MKSLYASMKTSENLETDGIWLNIGDHTFIKHSRAGGSNKKYNAEVARVAAKHKRAIALDLLSSETDKQMLFEIYANTVVVDWLSYAEGGGLSNDGTPDAKGNYVRGISNEKGEIVDASPANILKVFTDIPDLFFAVKANAEDASVFRQSIIEDISKN